MKFLDSVFGVEISKLEGDMRFQFQTFELIVPDNNPLQSNLYDCGVYVIRNMQYYGTSWHENVSWLNMSYILFRAYLYLYRLLIYGFYGFDSSTPPTNEYGCSLRLYVIQKMRWLDIWKNLWIAIRVLLALTLSGISLRCLTTHALWIQGRYTLEKRNWSRCPAPQLLWEGSLVLVDPGDQSHTSCLPFTFLYLWVFTWLYCTYIRYPFLCSAHSCVHGILK